MAEFRMPQLGADMAAGTLAEWLKRPGDPVARGDIIAVVETDKGAIEVEIFEEGVIDRLLVEPGAKVPVGAVLATVRGKDQPAGVTTVAESEVPSVARAYPAAAAPSAGPAIAQDARSVATPRTGLRVSPAAARLAAERGIDLRVLRGTGPEGAIRIADVEAGAPVEVVAAPFRSATDEAEPRTPANAAAAARRAIAAAMARSNRDIPHYYLASSIDFTPATDWLQQTNASLPVTRRLLYGVLLLKAVALALREFPEFNGFWRNDRFEAGPGIHVGSAIAIRGGGLVAPAIHDADRQDLGTLMAALRDLVARARSLRLRSSELADSTITVTSLGEQSVDGVFGVIYPPQVALVGFGTPGDRPWIKDGAMASRRLIQATLAGDHRATDGHRGALFLNRIAGLLQEPERL